MQRVHLSPGTALCRYCGERFATYSLSTHIAKVHRRSVRTNLSPTLVRKPRAAKKLPSK
jgi:hypothetical protein